ncbi:Uncharacterised protein [Mycobacterium tuberculosis]|uniref:Uncharacterized protein n=1 Tax=Mycobacterium tuberculosis TaxID=1773 RepID=A0A0T9FTY9_MYCTX|nr:Uncharacterised protein [Mycobacterium tuberculosis]CFS62828.1 Uncharacterised protein [Mycobacterium tuberculosis]CKV03768.1 Uncharacterised protein [Mycobacterium tuberculosis]COV97287.1 Uncharacterised protein [Mycobacterium tuberculosis]
MLHRFRRSARIAGDYRHAGGGGFEEHDAQALDVHPGAAGAAWHGEHVGQCVVGGKFVGCHAAGERHVVGHPTVVSQLAQRL